MTTTTVLSQAIGLKNHRLRELIQEVAEDKLSPDNVIARAESLGCLSELPALVATYQRRKQALADLAECERIREESNSLQAKRREVNEQVAALCNEHRRIEQQARLPIVELDQQIAACTDRSRQLNYDATMTLKQTESPAIEARLAELALTWTPIRARIRHHEAEVVRIERNVASLKAELAEEKQYVSDRDRQRLANIPARIEALKQQRDGYKGAIRQDKEALRPLEEEHSQLVATKNDPLSFLPPV